MQKLEYYSRQKESWSEEELKQIKDEYETKELSISEIADIHRRTPGSIAFKLKNIDLIPHYTVSRGYSEYIHSALYKEIVENGKNEYNEKKAKKEAITAEKNVIREGKIAERPLRVRGAAATEVITTQSKEIAELKNEIISLKKDVKEMLRLMNSLYEFETQ